MMVPSTYWLSQPDPQIMEQTVVEREEREGQSLERWGTSAHISYFAWSVKDAGKNASQKSASEKWKHWHTLNDSRIANTWTEKRANLACLPRIWTSMCLCMGAGLLTMNLLKETPHQSWRHCLSLADKKLHSSKKGRSSTQHSALPSEIQTP